MKDLTRMVLDQRGKDRSLQEWLNVILSSEEIH